MQDQEVEGPWKCTFQSCDLVRHFPGPAFSSYCYLVFRHFWSCKFSAPCSVLTQVIFKYMLLCWRNNLFLVLHNNVVRYSYYRPHCIYFRRIPTSVAIQDIVYYNTILMAYWSEVMVQCPQFGETVKNWKQHKYLWFSAFPNFRKIGKFAASVERPIARNVSALDGVFHPQSDQEAILIFPKSHQPNQSGIASLTVHMHRQFHAKTVINRLIWPGR